MSLNVFVTVLVLIWMVPSLAFLAPASVLRKSRSAVANGGRSDDPSHSSPSTQSIDISDLGITVADLNAPLPDELFGYVAFTGYESSRRLTTGETKGDDAIEWTETQTEVEAVLRIPGLIGQPAAAVRVDITPTSLAVLVFGKLVWSAVLRGTAVPDSGTYFVIEGADAYDAIISVSVEKSDTSKRWGGFIESIGEDSIL